MEWKPITQDEVKNLTFASRSGSRDNPYTPILDATAQGPVKVNASNEKELQSLKWGLSRAAKRAALTITISTIADKSGVVITRATEPPKPPAALPKK